MDIYQNKVKLAIGLIVLGIVLMIVSFFLLPDLSAFFIFGFLSFIAFCAGAIIWYYAKKNEEERQRLIRLKKHKEKVSVSQSIEQSINLESAPINIEFKKKYGISFLQFKEAKNYGTIKLYDLNSSLPIWYLRLIEWNNEMYFLLYSDYNNSASDKAILEKMWSSESSKAYFDLSLEKIEKLLFKFDEIEFVEYVNYVKKINSGIKSSNLDLALHEELFGTASAINKANNNNKTLEFDHSYLKFHFTRNSGISVKRYILSPTELQGEIYYSGALAKVWSLKEKNVVSTSNMINSSKPNNISSDPYNKLRELKSLLDDGIITQEEFDEEKRKILNK